MPRRHNDAIELPEQASPATPPAGFVRLFTKADHKPWIKDSTGLETDLTAAGGGIPTYIQDVAPTSPPAQYMWWQTNIGGNAANFTLWVTV